MYEKTDVKEFEILSNIQYVFNSLNYYIHTENVSKTKPWL